MTANRVAQVEALLKLLVLWMAVEIALGCRRAWEWAGGPDLRGSKR